MVVRQIEVLLMADDESDPNVPLLRSASARDEFQMSVGFHNLSTVPIEATDSMRL